MKFLMSVAVAAVLSGGAALAADVANGEKVFAQRCKTCHMIVDPAGKQIVKGGKTGPNQYALIGGHAGHDATFTRYGDSLKAAGAKGLIWTEEEVVKYLEDPRAYLRAYLGDEKARSNMAYKLPDATARADVAAYLAQFK